MNIFDIVKPANVVAYYDARKADQTAYLGDVLFPAQKVPGIEVNKINGYAGLPVELKASNFDAQATYRDRQSVTVSKQKMPLYRERMRVDEETRQKIMTVSNDAVVKSYIPLIFDDTTNLIRGARVARERMAMELISTGHIKITGNGVKLDYNYGLDKKHQMAKPDVAWSNSSTATPLTDMMDWVDEFRTFYGISLGYAIMTTHTFNLIKASKEVRDTLYPTASSAASILVTSAQVKELVQNAVGVQILINDNVYATSVGGAGKKFFPDDVVTFIPVGSSRGIGNMMFGTTPEEVDLLSNPKFADNIRIVDTGVAVYTRTLDHPVNVETIVSQICLPSFGADVEGGAGSVLIANVG